MTVVQQTPGTRTYLEAVKRIVAACGQNEPATLSSPSLTVRRAMRAVEDARDQIYYKARWKFRRDFFPVDLVANQMWYELPEDFDDFASGISVNDVTPPLAFIEWERLLQEYPWLRSYPPGAGIMDLTLVLQLSAQDQAFGIPSVYTQWGLDYVGLMRIPDADYVDAQVKLVGSYWRSPASLVSDSDSIDLSRDLWKCHTMLAQASLKEALEFKDWRDDEALGQQFLRDAVAGSRSHQDRDDTMTMAINYNE